MRYEDANIFHRWMRKLISTKPVAFVMARSMHHIDRAMFRVSGKRYTVGPVVSGLPVLMLETVGAKTGKLRQTPLLAIPDGDNIAITASNWGQKTYPGWYYNLRAEPDAWATINRNRRKVHAREAVGEEHQRLWELGQRYYPGWPKYEARSGGRAMHIFVLEPVAPLAAAEPAVTESEPAPMSRA